MLLVFAAAASLLQPPPRLLSATVASGPSHVVVLPGQSGRRAGCAMIQKAALESEEAVPVVRAPRAITRVFTMRVCATLMSVVSAFTLVLAVVEPWSLSDSLYFTTTTLATIGFGDLRPVTRVGRFITSLLGLCGVGLLGGLVSAVVGEWERSTAEDAEVQGKEAAALGLASTPRAWMRPWVTRVFAIHTGTFAVLELGLLLGLGTLGFKASCPPAASRPRSAALLPPALHSPHSCLRASLCAPPCHGPLRARVAPPPPAPPGRISPSAPPPLPLRSPSAPPPLPPNTQQPYPTTHHKVPLVGRRAAPARVGCAEREFELSVRRDDGELLEVRGHARAVGRPVARHRHCDLGASPALFVRLLSVLFDLGGRRGASGRSQKGATGGIGGWMSRCWRPGSLSSVFRLVLAGADNEPGLRLRPFPFRC